MNNPNLNPSKDFPSLVTITAIGNEALGAVLDFDRSATSHLAPPAHDQGTIFGKVYPRLTKQEEDELTSVD